MIDPHNSRPGALGATRLFDGSWQFVVWAPHRERVELHLLEGQPEFQLMEEDALGYHHVVARNIAPGSRYFYRLDGSQERPDPASRFQPEGVHGPSAIVDLRTGEWTDASWKGLPLEEMVSYELHAGTFTPEGTLSGLRSRGRAAAVVSSALLVVPAMARRVLVHPVLLGPRHPLPPGNPARRSSCVQSA